MHALIPRYCKSAGTLIALGASALYMDDRSELGPLDMQVTRGDEIGAMRSGLEQTTAKPWQSLCPTTPRTPS